MEVGCRFLGEASVEGQSLRRTRGTLSQTTECQPGSPGVWIKAACLPDRRSKNTPHRRYSRCCPVPDSVTSVQEVFPLSPAFVLFLPSLDSSQHTHMPECLLSDKTKTHCCVAIGAWRLPHTQFLNYSSNEWRDMFTTGTSFFYPIKSFSSLPPSHLHPPELVA